MINPETQWEMHFSRSFESKCSTKHLKAKNRKQPIAFNYRMYNDYLFLKLLLAIPNRVKPILDFI